MYKLCKKGKKNIGNAIILKSTKFRFHFIFILKSNIEYGVGCKRQPRKMNKIKFQTYKDIEKCAN